MLATLGERSRAKLAPTEEKTVDEWSRAKLAPTEEKTVDEWSRAKLAPTEEKTVDEWSRAKLAPTEEKKRLMPKTLHTLALNNSWTCLSNFGIMHKYRLFCELTFRNS